MKKRILCTTMLMVLGCIFAQAQSHVAEPAVNLGDSSFLDGIGGPGFLTEEMIVGVPAYVDAGSQGDRGGFGDLIDSCVEGFHKIQNDCEDSLLADRSINHGVVHGAVRPFDVEILAEKIGAFPINRIYQLFRISLAFAAGYEAPQFIFSGSIKKHPQRVLAVLEKLLRTSSDDDGASFFRGMLNDTFRNFENAFGVDQVKLVRIEASFITPAQE
jgi:hypothetical protein